MQLTEKTILIIVLATALLTYALRAIPLVLLRRKITNPYISALLNYMPYAILSAMIFPAIFSSTAYTTSATIGLICACIMSLLGKSLPIVACFTCLIVFISEYVIKFFS